MLIGAALTPREENDQSRRVVVAPRILNAELTSRLSAFQGNKQQVGIDGLVICYCCSCFVIVVVNSGFVAPDIDGSGVLLLLLLTGLARAASVSIQVGGQ